MHCFLFNRDVGCRQCICAKTTLINLMSQMETPLKDSTSQGQKMTVYLLSQTVSYAQEDRHFLCKCFYFVCEEVTVKSAAC